MNILDILLSIFLLLGFVRGIFKGFLVELAGLVALIAGIYGAIHFSDGILRLLQTFISWEERYLSLVAFAVTFCLIVAIISVLARLLTKVINFLALGILNRILGAIFGMLKTAFLASLFLMFLDHFIAFAIEPETRQESVLYRPVAGIAPLLLPTIIEQIKEGDIFEATPEDEKPAETSFLYSQEGKGK